MKFSQYPQITKVVIPDGVKLQNGVAGLFCDMRNLKNVNIHENLFSNVTNMSLTYYRCYNLTGSPVCGEKVVDMSETYRQCYNLAGSPVCGNNVTNMYFTYDECYNLTGSPVCGEKVVDMVGAYHQCYNLTGSPVCGNNVTKMGDTTFSYGAYYHCYNLTGSPVCGEKVEKMPYTYYECPNLYGNMYMYSPNVSNVQSCFYGRNTSNMLNIYVTANSTSQTTLMNYTNTYSIIGKNCTWTNDTTNNRYYNTAANIYIYPVENVAAAREANGD